MDNDDLSGDNEPDLGANKSDVGAAVLRSAVGLVPFAGGILSEIITHIIPNQRADRIEQYVRLLSLRLDTLSDELQKWLRTDPEAVALFEDGAFLSSRAVSKERIEQVATIVASGLTDEQRDALRWRRLLDVLRQLDDQELAILRAYADTSGASWDMFARLRPSAVARDGRGLDALALWDASYSKMEGLSLIHFRQETEKTGSFTSTPIFDAFGKRKGHHMITDFGRQFVAAVTGMAT